MNRIGLIILLAVAAFVGLDSCFVLQEGQVAIVTQFGEYKYTVHKPGIEDKLPFAQQVHRMERRIIGSDTPPAEFLTRDKKKLVTDPVTRWRIVDPLTFYKTVRDESGAKARLARHYVAVVFAGVAVVCLWAVAIGLLRVPLLVDGLLTELR